MRVTTFHARLPRHPLLRALVVLAGVLLLAGLLAIGMLVGAAIVVAASAAMAIRHWLRRRRDRRTAPEIIEGEFTIMPRGGRSALPSSDPATTTRSGWQAR